MFEVKLPLVYLFRHPTLAELAASIEEAIIEQIEKIRDEEAEQLSRNESQADGVRCPQELEASSDRWG